MKQTIRLNERELHNLISESVKRSLNEKYGVWPKQRGDNYYTNPYLYNGHIVKPCNNWDEAMDRFENFASKLADIIQLQFANEAYELKKYNPDLYDAVMKVRSKLIQAGGCGLVDMMKDYDGSIVEPDESERDYRREMRYAEQMG